MGRVDVIMRDEYLSLRRLSGRSHPLGIKDRLLRPQIGGRVTMTVEAPAHVPEKTPVNCLFDDDPRQKMSDENPNQLNLFN
jgi:hypothetical protein